MKKRIVQIIQAGLGILLIALTVEIIYMLYMRLDWTVTMPFKFIMWSFTLDLITSLILLLSFGYERYLYQRTMKTVMELQGKLESYGDVADLSEIQLDSYICTLETAAIMHRAGEISLKEFYSQFGYSLERLLRDSRANALMQKHICLNEIVYKERFLKSCHTWNSKMKQATHRQEYAKFSLSKVESIGLNIG